ncbi:MAG TPA: hypothetical protein PKG60_15905 [Spirochaetota bacterium]|nr:hypothetical protein [Spirochaetota bacterium]
MEQLTAVMVFGLNIYKVNVDGTGITQLTASSADDQPCFEWKPK